MVKCGTLPKWFRRKEKEIEKERVIRISDSEFNRSFNYANNVITTNKYTVFTFLPKNLFEQFQRIANAYFLGLLILQLIPQISSLTPITTVIPLVCVLSLTALKDGIDDIRRYHNDKLVNNRESFVLRDGKIVTDKWCRVEVGDILKLTNDQFVAADLLLLSSSEPNGLCYIETAELDGETNLKCRQALPETACLEDDIKEMEKFDAEIICEPPNNRLNKFEGTITFNGKTLPLDNDKVLLRGCVLRNTKWCYGAVLFAGRDTKLMQNSGKDIFKRTSIDRLVNVLIIGIFIFLISICLFTAIAHGIWQGKVGIYFRIILPWASFIPPERIFSGIVAISSLTFLSYIILLNTLVPISLYVSVEMIRIAHSFWINWDIKMYDPKTNTPAKARTTTLNEELGQIQYIFSDKTGTLTQNIMVFKKCSIAGDLYGYVEDNQGNLLSPSEKDPSVDLSWNPYHEAKFKFADQRLIDKIRGGDSNVVKFFTLLALCHTVMPGEKKGILEYLVQSPDEGALVSAARNFGIVFLSRTPNSITISLNGKEMRYEVLAILDFNNVRKRMSVIIRKDGKITLFCKGADSVIMERLNQKDQKTLINTTLEHLTKFAVEGLRTLCLAYKDISNLEYTNWEIRYQKTNACLKDREARLDELYEEIETNLHLLGATAIEDKLQDGVPQTIANLLRAGIRIWVLTGDKQETAINIGYSCQLLNDDVEEIYIIDGQEFEEVEKELECVRKTIHSPSPQLLIPSLGRANNVATPSPMPNRSEIGSPLSACSSNDPVKPRRSWFKRLCCPNSLSNVYQKQISLDTQWEEWNDRIRRNFYWLIAPPSYNYNYYPTSVKPIRSNNVIVASKSEANMHPNNNQHNFPHADALNRVNDDDNKSHHLNLNNNNSNCEPKLTATSANKTFASSVTAPDLGATGSVAASNRNKLVAGRYPSSGTTGLKQPEIESMRIDVRITPPNSKTSTLDGKVPPNLNPSTSTPGAVLPETLEPINSGCNVTSTNGNLYPFPAVVVHDTNPNKIGGVKLGLTPPALSFNPESITGRKSPVSPYEARLRYPSKEMGYAGGSSSQSSEKSKTPSPNLATPKMGLKNKTLSTLTPTNIGKNHDEETLPNTGDTLKRIEVFTFDTDQRTGQLNMIEKMEPRYEPAQPQGNGQADSPKRHKDNPPSPTIKVTPVEEILSVRKEGYYLQNSPGIERCSASFNGVDRDGPNQFTTEDDNSLALDDFNGEDNLHDGSLESLHNMILLQPGANGYSNGGIPSPIPPPTSNNFYDKPSIFALVISGHSLVHALDPRLEQEFVELGSAAMSVICCRVTPLQKAMVVDVVKRHKKATTLAIGDGANDVSMIRRANIGIGISGLEGRQAVLASDFAIAQFRFLERLILVHGRWSYYRMTKFLRYFFYKNFAFTLCSFWYGFFCGFSAQSLFDPWFISFYNLFYTSLPVLALAFFEQDVDDEMCIRYPQLYRSSLGNKLFNKKIFAQSILHGIITSFILFIIPYFSFTDGMSSQGKETGLYVFGILVSTCLIFTVSLQAGLDTSYWTGFNHFVIWGSIIFYLAMHFLMYSPMFNRTFVGVMLAATGQPKFWFTVILTVAILILPVLALRSYFCDTRPNLADRIRYAQRIYNAKRRKKQKDSAAAAASSAQGPKSLAIQTISKFPFLPFPPPHYYDFLTSNNKSRGSIGQSVKPRKASLRTGYAFAHQQGFGDLIIKGTSFRPIRGSFSDALQDDDSRSNKPTTSSNTKHSSEPKRQGSLTARQSTDNLKSVDVTQHKPKSAPVLLAAEKPKHLFTFLDASDDNDSNKNTNGHKSRNKVITTALSPSALVPKKGSANFTPSLDRKNPDKESSNKVEKVFLVHKSPSSPQPIQTKDGESYLPLEGTSHSYDTSYNPTIPRNDEPGIKVINYRQIKSATNSLDNKSSNLQTQIREKSSGKKSNKYKNMITEL